MFSNSVFHTLRRLLSDFWLPWIIIILSWILMKNSRQVLNCAELPLDLALFSFSPVPDINYIHSLEAGFIFRSDWLIKANKIKCHHSCHLGLCDWVSSNSYLLSGLYIYCCYLPSLCLSMFLFSPWTHYWNPIYLLLALHYLLRGEIICLYSRFRGYSLF